MSKSINNNNNNVKVFETPYQAAKYVNGILTKYNLKNIPGPMMYNYTTAKVNKGEKPLIKVVNGKVDYEDLNRWLFKVYLPKKGIVVKEAEVDYAYLV